ncbi:uncharacterized protein LACBIDRAFT_313071 [Laccaria bicolor S238N-H82]|uniref:Predicted protein n=1 Tax=Laccaria bicolor (strain S238N-H82 / ATCC MYA-4686) TaxID=486041 RepID=B0DXG6_LACBS|nr:uncharacterized protein LACBIDRAFT_313071 [Laccaria bicolor S238N-H82]EDR00617.1 predicted protein [Laccaria bicolor S238N-H82]|eukprot:XP_001888626.1 predicted protein [Laccaria bicolor S238N-H82]
MRIAIHLIPTRTQKTLASVQYCEGLKVRQSLINFKFGPGGGLIFRIMCTKQAPVLVRCMALYIVADLDQDTYMCAGPLQASPAEPRIY